MVHLMAETNSLWAVLNTRPLPHTFITAQALICVLDNASLSHW